MAWCLFCAEPGGTPWRPQRPHMELYYNPVVMRCRRSVFQALHGGPAGYRFDGRVSGPASLDGNPGALARRACEPSAGSRVT